MRLECWQLRMSEATQRRTLELIEEVVSIAEMIWPARGDPGWPGPDGVALLSLADVNDVRIRLGNVAFEARALAGFYKKALPWNRPKPEDMPEFAEGVGG